MKLAALAPWWDRGTSWWDQRSLREQILLGVFAALALLALLLVLVFRPLETIRARAAADIRTYDMLDVRLRTAGPGLASSGRRGTPSDLITQSAASAGLAVQQLAPEGKRIRVVFADGSFESVLRWASAIESEGGLRIVTARVSRSASGTGVSASFLVE